MSAIQNISCGRCQSKKVRCNRVSPQCGNCEAAGAECVYLPRKPRSKKQVNAPPDKRLLLEIIDRLKRLEEQVGLENTPETEDNGDDTMSISSVGSEAPRAISLDKDPAQVVPSVIRDITSTALEGYNTDLAWKAFSHTCRISKTLGYFSVDETPSEGDNQPSTPAGTPLHEAEVERNRKRFVFWHILRTDSLFRKSFGKPTLIPAGSWKVHFPDPTINGVDDESSRFIQIHFLISMRLGLIVRKYLDWIDSGPDPDPVSHDAIIHTYIDEVQSILSDWDTASLLRTLSNYVDSWLCIDVLVGSYEILIVLHLSKKCDHGHLLPYEAVNLARKSLKIFQSLLGSTSQAFWGISPITMYQFLPFFILCLDIICNPDHENLDEDLGTVTWVCDYVKMAAEGRVELKPVMIIIKEMVTACQRTKMDRLSRSVTTGE
ncbi:fungal specific transcription factor [Aspergillus flavus]|uniref:Fungal specific transcription factor n=1 Tax=Aspergillus flavus TaxID=5059 RepID=A0AB74CHT2_ASPFL|nr:fungal specific transcription factor [Aspergillus flavus]RAQ79184.1 fungal specific transcription factor [Aspergillus flavus]RMZ45738.1 fungal specific transcription factor [Aspergillus flavus]